MTLTIKLTNESMAAAASDEERHRYHHQIITQPETTYKIDKNDEIEEPRYNN